MPTMHSHAGGPSGHTEQQTVLYGMTSNGDLVRLDKATGAGTLIGNSGFIANDAAADPRGLIFSGGGVADQIILVDPTTGAGSVFLTTTGRPVGYGIRGMAFEASGRLYVALSKADTAAVDLLAMIDMTLGAYTIVGPTGCTDIQALAWSPGGTLYALGRQLYTLDAATGAATTIGGGSFGDDGQALAFDRDGTLYACRAGLRRVDPATGRASLLGPTGFSDIRGLAVVSWGAAARAP